MSLPINKPAQKSGSAFLSQFKEIGLSDKDTFGRFFENFPPEISELTFTNLFAFKDAYNFKFCIFKGALLIGSFRQDKIYFFYPVGSENPAGLIKEILTILPERLQFFRVPQAIKELIAKGPGLKIEADPNNFDYVYLASDLIGLKGKEFDGKRNFIKRFKTKFQYAYLPVTPELISRALEFEEVWCLDKYCQTIDGLRKERAAILKMLNNFSLLSLKGAALEVDKKIIALSLGEQLNEDTFVIHVEKANNNYPGAYQVINQEFCARQALKYKYVNREQDLGLPGLRKAKSSYHPVKLLKKFTISLRGAGL